MTEEAEIGTSTVFRRLLESGKKAQRTAITCLTKNKRLTWARKISELDRRVRKFLFTDKK